MKTDKVIVGNRQALGDKYGSPGRAAVEKALRSLIAADKKRGLRTIVVWIDNPKTMATYKGKAPINPGDQRGAKRAVDAIATALAPDYIALLDGPDVIPHVTLDNPTPSDDDTGVDSDLPYACAAAFSTDPADYLAVTRVVGRIPNVPGAPKPDRLLKVIDTAIQARPSAPAEYQPYFGLSAEVWRQSTELSLDSVFSAHADLKISPPSAPPGTDGSLKALSHFINCHGASLTPEFYGQHGSKYPVSMTSAQVAGHVAAKTVAAAECCYGAQLYDTTLLSIADPICMAYLGRGALGFLGSTNIAYGPPAANGQADLITQYFMQHVLAGASLGRSLLQARQRLIANTKMSDPTNLKTLAQFILLGDPSITPCAAPKQYSATQGIGANNAADEASQRKARRLTLASNGVAIASAKSVAAGPGAAPAAVKERVREMARHRGFKIDKEKVYAVAPAAARGPRAKAKAAAGSPAESVMVLTDIDNSPALTNGTEAAPITRVRHFVAHIFDKGIASISEVISR